MNYFFVDAETDGLYGEVIAIAAIIIDINGEEKDKFAAKIKGLSSESMKDEWTRYNVLPLLDSSLEEYEGRTSLLEGFWDFWLKYREDVICIADVQYPVEANLFRKCVELDLENRNFLGPYPLYDLSTILLIKGISPSVDRVKLLGEDSFEKHNPLDDVRITARLWRKLNG